jgi:uncharacterized membrane protein YfcA
MIEITTQIIYFTLIGSITGILSGLLGVGGGIISIPCIIFMFEFLGKSTPLTMRIAIGSSLAAMIFTTFSSAKSHNLHKRICWPLFKKIYFSFVLGAITGTFFVHEIPSNTLKKIFGCFEVILGCYFFIMKSSPSSINKPLLGASTMNGLGYLISTLSTLLGIGGSIMTVPALVYLKLSLKEAIGTSTALSFIVSVVASVSFLITDLFIQEEPYTIGYIYLPAFLPISIASFFTAPIGSKLMQKISTKILKKFFAILVASMGLIMLIK